MAKKADQQVQKDGEVAYRAPALEKGLDILELLASQSGGLTLSQIAHNLERSVQEVYRVVQSLERRSYVERRQPGDAFHLTMKLFDLASKHPPTRRLLEAGQPVLQKLANDIDEAVILSIIDGSGTRVVMVADNPAPIGFRVRLGTQGRLLSTASGRTLLAFQDPTVRQALLETVRPEYEGRDGEFERLVGRVDRIAKRGYEVVADETLKGITDVSFPIVDGSGQALSALTMPFLSWVTSKVELAQASEQLFKAAAQLCRQLGGELPVKKFTLE